MLDRSNVTQSTSKVSFVFQNWNPDSRVHLGDNGFGSPQRHRGHRESQILRIRIKAIRAVCVVRSNGPFEDLLLCALCVSVVNQVCQYLHLLAGY